MQQLATACETGQTLVSRLKRLGVRWRTLLILRAGSRIVLACMLAALSIILLDYRYHVMPLLRALTLFAILTGFLYCCRKSILLPWRQSRGLRALAGRVEWQFPEFNDSLISAVQFVELPTDSLSGSPVLRDEAIRHATMLMDELDTNEAIPSRGMKRSLVVLALVLGGIGYLTANDLPTAMHAAARLVDPYGLHPWPARTQIDIVAPTSFPYRAVRREPFEIHAILRGTVPDRATVSFWNDDARPTEQACPVTRVEGSPNEGTLIVRVDAERLERGLAVRIRALDADTGWQRIDVHTPPFLVPRDGRPSPQIDLEYPRYTGLPSHSLLDGSGTMEMVTGTRVRLRAAVDRPLASARLVARPNLVKLPWTQPITPLSGISAMSAAAYLAISDEFRQEIPVHLHGDRQLLDIDFFPRYSGSYALRIADEDGFWSERLFEVRVDADPAPRVLLLKQNDDDLTALVPEADVPIQAIVCDEQYGIRSVQLEYRTEATQAFRGWPMADAAKQHIIGDALLPLMAMPCRFPHLERPKPKQWPLAATYPLSLFRRSDGTALREGDTIALRISARDWDDVTWNKPAGVSETAEISIVSPDQIEAALLKKLAQLRNDLLMIRDQQTIARQRLRDLIEAPAKSADALAEIERLQQQIQAAVISNIRPRLGQLERGVRNNNLPDSRTSQRIAMAKAEIEQLLQRELSPLPALLEQGRQTPAALPQAERLQSEAIERLQALIDRLHAWNGTAEARGETRALVGELRKLIERLDDVQQSQSGAATGIRRDELNEFRRNELDSLTQSIDSVREKARLLLERLEQQARSPENIPSAELDRLRAALKKLDRPALGQGLQSAAEQAKQNRLSDARGALGKACAPLAKLLQDLDEKPPAEEFDRLKKAARANSKEIDRLIDAQEKLQHRIDEAGRLADPAERARQLRALAGEQSKIRDQAEEVIRTLTRQGEDRTLAQVRQAAREMEKTRQQLEDGQVPTGERDAALDSLDEGKEAVEQQAEKAAEELARVQQAQDGDLIRALRERQAGLRDEAARLHAKVGEQKQWDAATARGSLPGLIESQGGLAIETRRLLETRFKGELVSAALLNQAASSMEGATKRLQERKEDVLDQLDGLVQYDAMIENAHQTRIIAEQDRALRRLDLLLDTAKPDASKKDAAKSGEPKQGNESARNNLPSKAQLKVLRALQAELKDRTTEFDRQHPDRQKLGEAARLQLDALTREQDEFVELVRSLTAGVREELP